MKKVAFLGSGDDPAVEVLFRPLILGKDCRVEGTFSFSADHRGSFNEYARHLGVIVIMSNPIYRRWEEEFLDAVEDFRPDIIFDFGFDRSLPSVEIPIWRVVNLDPFYIIVSPEKKASFVGDREGAVAFLKRLLCGEGL